MQIPSLAVLKTEKLAFQCATLLILEYGLGIRLMNLAVLCGDFWTIFFVVFMLSVSIP